MNSIVYVLPLLAFATGLPQNQAPSGGAAPANAGAANQGGTGGGLGPRFFGPGLRNPLALPPNQFALNAAKNVLRSNPNVLARVLPNGEIEFTNQFGQEVEVVDTFGRDPLDFEESLKFEKKRLEQQFEFEQERRELQAEQQLLNQLLGSARGRTSNNAGGGLGQGGFIVRN